MDRDDFMQQVSDLRQRGTSIRGIASKLGVHPSRVQRAVAKLSPPGTDTSNHNVSNGDRKSVFVGREEEMALLRQMLDESVAGHGNIVLLSGEPGIGKTRMAHELCSYAGGRQVSYYWGRCHEEPQAPPFWPWIQILRAYIQQHRVSRLRSEMGPWAADIGGIVPRLLQKLPEIKLTPPLNDPSKDRFRLFDSISGFFKQTSKRQPMLLILDNLQCCDESSLLLLQFISQELADNRILVVGSYRNMGLEHGHPLTTTLGELSRQSSFRQLELQGLNQKETEELACSQDPFNSSKEFMETLYKRTDGNPLFIIHIVRSLIKAGSLTGQEGELDLSRLNTIPDSLHMAISRNLAYLSPQCLEVLTAASAIGRQFNLLILQRTVKDLTADELQDFIYEAVRGEIIRPKKLGAGWYQFTHALVQEALLSGMTAKQRVNLHARIGLALEEIYGNNIESFVASLAYHFARSADLTGTEKAIHYSRLAAERALSVFAYEEAVLQFQRALAIKRKKTPAAVYGIPDDETAEILLGLVKAGAATFLWSAHNSFQTVIHLLDYYLDKKDISKVIEIAKIPIITGDRTRLFELKMRFERIFSMLDPDSPEAGWLLCIYGNFLGIYAGERDVARDAFERALVTARLLGDQYMEMRILINSVMVKAAYWESDWDGVLRVIDMAKQLEERQVEAIGRFYCAAFATTTRQCREALDLWESAMFVATQLRNHILLNALNFTGQILAQYYGDFQVARNRSEVIKGFGRNIMGTMVRAISEYELGEFEQGDRFVRQAVEGLEHVTVGPSPEYGWSVSQFPFINYLTGREEWSEIEDRAINIVLNSASPEHFFSINAQVGIGLRAINRGDINTAQQSYNWLKGPLKSEHFRSMITSIAMSSDRLLGLLCLTFEDYDKAVEHFQVAIELCREWEFTPQLAWSCYDCSRAMLRRNKPGDNVKANNLAAQALSVADELGMKLLVDRINSTQGVEMSKQVSSADYNNFTSREIEVLKLLAVGMTNREIAQELVISTYTAATHVRNILNKGNLANRVEAAAFATRHYPPEQ